MHSAPSTARVGCKLLQAPQCLGNPTCRI